jgi:hypothetical protein
MDMSIPVELPGLPEVMARYRFAYLLTGTAQGAPHAVAVTPTLEGGVLRIDGIGRSSRANLLARPVVGLVWPPESALDYSLIVDGQAAMDGDSLRITPIRAVLHRPAPGSRPVVAQGCGADCVALALPTGERRDSR